MSWPVSVFVGCGTWIPWTSPGSELATRANDLCRVKCADRRHGELSEPGIAGNLVEKLVVSPSNIGQYTKQQVHVSLGLHKSNLRNELFQLLATEQPLLRRRGRDSQDVPEEQGLFVAILQSSIGV